ncbi:MAG: DUF262 domain-containing protein [Deltaproteobacteria bacterium]|nr:DUF262 domain-containing protein [Deltaproteobacteria bacterium]
MLQPENQNKKYERLFIEIHDGQIKIPNFQRNFVWDKLQTAKLVDSIIKGFPIGTFILWKTREEMRHYKSIGNDELPKTKKGSTSFYILDGQQRITSLYAVRKGLIYKFINKNGDKMEIDYKDISIDLSLDPDADEEVVLVDPPADKPYISVHELLSGTFTKWMKRYDEEGLEKIETYQKRLTGYDFSTIVMPDYPLDIACEVFTRINTGGTELTLFEIMVAKTYDEKDRFDLLEKYNDLIHNSNSEKDLESVGYETIPDTTVLQCVSAYLVKQVRRRDILKLNKTKFINSWETVKDGIFYAVDYLRKSLIVPVSGLLPYNAILVPFSYFFIKMKGKRPSTIQNKLLKQYFFWASLSERFSSGAEGKIALDLKKMDRILKEQPPSYRGEEVKLTEDEIEESWFSAGNSFCKAIICIFASFKPLSFDGEAEVELGNNAWLKRANSKNYHHFFPKSYLKKKGYEDWEINTISNITLVDDYLNKRTIGSKAPSVYMKQFIKNNKHIEKTMKSHLIDDLDDCGVLENDYEAFKSKRSKKILKEINKRLNPKI